jgi:hypothetical protein
MMYMLGAVLTNLLQKATSLICNATALITKKLLGLLGVLTAQMTQLVILCQRLSSQIVQTVLKIKLLLASLIILVQSTKLELINVKAKVLQIGLLLQTTVAQILHLAPIVQKQKKGKPVGITKSARSHLKENKTAQTPTAALLTQDGLKSQGRAKQRHQRAKQQLKTKH